METLLKLLPKKIDLEAPILEFIQFTMEVVNSINHTVLLRRLPLEEKM